MDKEKQDLSEQIAEGVKKGISGFINDLSKGLLISMLIIVAVVTALVLISNWYTNYQFNRCLEDPECTFPPSPQLGPSEPKTLYCEVVTPDGNILDSRQMKDYLDAAMWFEITANQGKWAGHGQVNLECEYH